MIEELLKKPVIGCIPMEEIDIDDEDSLSIRLQRTRAGDGVDVAVILFPHISNFTDFNVLERIPGISLRYVQRAEEVNNPDFFDFTRDKEYNGRSFVVETKKDGGRDFSITSKTSADYGNLWWISNAWAVAV